METNAIIDYEEIAEFAHHKDNLKTALNKMCESIIAAKKASKGSAKVDEIQLNSLTLFEAKKTQLRLETVKLAEAQKGIAQAGIQMMGEIQELDKFFVNPVNKYRSMLTNGLVWMQVMMSGRRKGKMRWVHSEPIVVIKEQKAGRTKYSIEQGAVDLVVDHILSVLITARCILQLLKKESQKLKTSKVCLFFMLNKSLYCLYVCVYLCI